MFSHLISIVIPCYNHAKYVEYCVRSVIAQDYPNIELIVIDDGSSDNSVENIEKLVPECERRFVRFEFRKRPNRGLSATLNEAIEWCQGDYFSAIASDDILLPEKTSSLLGLITQLRVSGVFGGAQIIDSSNRVLRTSRPKKGYISFEDLILRRKNPIAPSQLLELDAMREAGGYREDLFVEDLYMWLALTNRGMRLYQTDEVLVQYRVHEKNRRGVNLMYEGRRNVLDYFKNETLYKKALAVNSLVASFYQSEFTKADALRYLVEGVGYHKPIVFSKFFAQCLFRLVRPASKVL